jgi:hypothetical protein
VSALPLEPASTKQDAAGPAPHWPLLPSRPGSSWFGSALGAASARGGLTQLTGDVLIGLPLAVIGRAVTRVEWLRRWAVTD